MGSAAALIAAGFLTRSFGFLLGLLVLACAWLFLSHRRVIWNGLTALLLLLVIAGGAFYSTRRGVIEGDNPAGLRLKNWISAWTIFATHPLGTGANTYGIVYPRYMLPGANETQYAHNTPLQLMSEFGFPVVLVGVAVVLIAVKRWKPDSLSRAPQCVLLALAVWCVHNLVDINVYFPSVGVMGAVLIGVLLRKELQIPAGPGRAALVSVGLIGTLAIHFSGLAMMSTELQHRAQIEYQEKKPAAAVATLNTARALMPLNSSLFHDAGDILLDIHSKSRDPKDLEAAARSFRRAIRMSPMKVGPHIGLGLCLSWVNDLDGALKEVRTAEELYPDSTYATSVARLMEARKGN